MSEARRPIWGPLLALVYGITILVLSFWSGYALVDMLGLIEVVVGILIIALGVLMYFMPENKKILGRVIVILVVLSLLLGVRVEYYVASSLAS